MAGLGIQEGDIALVHLQEDVEDGQLAIVIIDDDEGTLKRVHRHGNTVTLDSANPAYPPRTFINEEINRLRIVGKVLELRRIF